MSKKVTFGPLPPGSKKGSGQIAGGRDYRLNPILNFRHTPKMLIENSKLFQYRKEIVRQFITINTADNIAIYETLTLTFPINQDIIINDPTNSFSTFDWKKDIINESNIIEFCEFLTEYLRLIELCEISVKRISKYDELETIIEDYYKLEDEQ